MIEPKLYALLAPVVADRVFPDVAPINTPRPYITYQQIGGQVINTYGKEVPSSRNAYVQINVWAETRLQASSIGLAVEDAMRTAAAFIAKPMAAAIAIHEEDVNLYGTQQDFSIWSDR